VLSTANLGAATLSPVRGVKIATILGLGSRGVKIATILGLGSRGVKIATVLGVGSRGVQGADR
jgi:hypothetical protein